MRAHSHRLIVHQALPLTFAAHLLINRNKSSVFPCAIYSDGAYFAPSQEPFICTLYECCFYVKQIKTTKSHNSKLVGLVLFIDHKILVNWMGELRWSLVVVVVEVFRLMVYTLRTLE